MSVIFASDPEQKFACRDCPARCCRMPWRTTVSESEKARILALEWVPERLASSRTAFESLPGGQIIIPTVEKNRILQCVFLDDDLLCSIHKREGIDATPQTCQTFPFGFIEGEDGTLQTYLSHLCPSIRDNYGDPLTPMLPEKVVRMKGLTHFKLVPQLRLGTGTIRQADYLAWADCVAELLGGTSSPSSSLAQVHAWTHDLASRMTPGQSFEGRILESAIPDPIPVPPLASGAWARSTRLLLAVCLLPVSYPKRVVSRQRGIARLGSFLASLEFVRRFVIQKKQADLLFLAQPVDLATAFSIPSPTSQPECQARLKRFLSQLLIRRNFFFADKSLEEIVFLLALSGSVITVFARMKAAAEGRSTCLATDLADGESMAEFLLTYHGNMIQSQKILEILTGFMATYPPTFQGLVETF